MSLLESMRRSSVRGYHSDETARLQRSRHGQGQEGGMTVSLYAGDIFSELYLPYIVRLHQR